MKLVAVLLSVSLSAPALAADETKLGRFLKTCAWGTAIGAGIGAVTLAFEDKPSEHSVNIARGASLGLYGGIMYGLVETEKNSRRMRQRPEIDDMVGVRPVLDQQRRISGAEALAFFSF